jgi:hypothetical protein
MTIIITAISCLAIGAAKRPSAFPESLAWRGATLKGIGKCSNI